MKIKVVFFIIITFSAILSSCEQKIENKRQINKINVGVFNGNGASAVCVIETLEALKIDSGLQPISISASEIMDGALDNLDVLVFPGGSGSKEYNNLGIVAADKVRAFAQQKGNGVVGICAGGYILASTPDYASLQMLPVHSIREYYNRGRGLISFSTTPEGDNIFPELSQRKESFVQYYDGPMYQNIDSAKFTTIAIVNTDIATKKGFPKGVSVGKPAFGIANYGDGRIIMTTGHPESTSGMRWMVPRMARWAADKPLITYGDLVVRPEKYSQELLFYPDDIKHEKDNFWKLSSDNDEEIIDALDNLYALNSRPSIRWSIGLLRHNSKVIRAKAADYLLETEYTWAIPDVESAYNHEADPETKEKLGFVLDKLKHMVH
jgi:glutamine amidotransferase-like uncharacterized protein